MKGILLNVDKLNRTASINVDKQGKISYKLAPFVKDVFLNSLINERVSFSTDKQDSSLLTFVTADAFKPNTHGDSGAVSINHTPFKSHYSPEVQERIASQWAINASIELFKANQGKFKDLITCDHILEVAKQLKEGSKTL